MVLTKIDDAICAPAGGVLHELRDGERELFEWVLRAVESVLVQGAVRGVGKEPGTDEK